MNISDSVLAASPLATIFADREGLIRFWNQAAESLFGHQACTALGQSLDIIIPEKLREAHWRGFHRAMESGKPRLGPGFIRTKALNAAGEAFYVALSFAIITDERGEPIGSAAFCKPAE